MATLPPHLNKLTTERLGRLREGDSLAADANGYYSALGLNTGASVDAIRFAYRRLAKECHPDRPGCVDGVQRFRRIAEAYEALSDTAFKTAYDSGAPNSTSNESTRPPPPPPKVEPTKCEVCGSVTAQPRRLAFWRITSFILASQKTPIQRIFCHTCAAKERWKSTIWTSLLGWWSVPWGPIWATGYGVRNAVGGTHQPTVDEALLWQNAVAFASRGEGALAIGLSNILRKSENTKIAQHAADIIRVFSERGFDASTTLKDVWKRSIVTTAVLLLISFAVPGALAALVFMPGTEGSHPFGTSPSSGENDPLAAVFGPQAETPQPVPAAAQEPNRPPEPACGSPPSNGQILVDHRGPSVDGHHLKIENGTAGDAIIKMRAVGGRTLASFFVQRGQTVTLTRIPDGNYTVQYASGDKLAKNCRKFMNDGTASASAFPGPETLETRYEKGFEGTSVVHSELTYTLYPVLGGTVHPNSIKMDEFNKP